MKTAYFDIFCGAAGDMIVASMLHAGLDAEYLKSQLDTLNLHDLTLDIQTVNRHGITAMMFVPKTSEHHPHRHLSDINAIIDNSGISDSAKSRSKKIFEKIAIAEAAIHGKKPDEIHFHEVGAVDSISDIVAACVGLEALGIEKVYSAPFTLGSGIINCAHGNIPAPAPATLEILKNAAAPTTPGPLAQELVTPTAAAIITEFADGYTTLPPMQIESIGYGAGTRVSEDFPNVLRLIIGTSANTDGSDTDSIALLETNIDDTTGETIGFVMQTLLDSGALDAWTSPIQMKNNRPAVTLSLISSPADVAKFEHLIFTQTGTFGIRKQFLQRSILKRKFVTVDTSFGPINIKTGYLADKLITAKPEYSDCAAAAKKHNTPIQLVTEQALSTFRNL